MQTSRRDRRDFLYKVEGVFTDEQERIFIDELIPDSPISDIAFLLLKGVFVEKLKVFRPAKGSLSERRLFRRLKM